MPATKRAKVHNNWKLTFKDQSYHEFDLQGRLDRVVNELGYLLTIQRPSNFTDPTIVFEGSPPQLPDTRRWEIQRKTLPNGKIVVDKIVEPLWPVGFPGDRRWLFAYDSKGKVIEVENPLGAKIGFGNDSRGRITTITDQKFATETAHTYTYEYTGNLLTRVTDPPLTTPVLDEEFTSALVGTEYRTTYTDRRAKQWLFAYDSIDETLIRATDPLNHSQSVEYDANRNPVLYTDAVGKEWSWTWDPKGNVLTATNPLLETKSWTYDSLNNLTSYTDELQHVTTLEYEHPNPAFGTLLTSIEEPGEGASVVTTTLSYYWNHATQPDGLLEMVVDPNLVETRFEYDEWGQLYFYGEGELVTQTAGALYPATLPYLFDQGHTSFPEEYHG